MKLSLLEACPHHDSGLSLDDIIDHGYSRKIMRIIRYIQELEAGGQLGQYGLSSSEPFAHGQSGAVFPSTEKGFVVKVSLDRFDKESANTFKNAQNPHFADVRSVKYMQLPEEEPREARDKQLCFIQMEKLNQFDDEQGDFLNRLLYPLIDKLNDEHRQLVDKNQLKLSKKMLRQIKAHYRENKGIMSPKERTLSRNMIRFLRDLHKSGHHFHDRQSSQFMSNKRGKLKLVDFGSIRKNL